MKKVFISGVSGGIGSEIAKQFLDNGYFVIGQYNNNKTGVDSLFDYAKNKGVEGQIFCVKADLSDSHQIADMLEKIKTCFKYIDVIVNNAGAGLYKLITDTTESEWDKLFSINTKSVFLINNAFIPSMIERQSGRIINISSMWGEVGASMEVCYSASKSAVIGYTKALSKELAPSNITVNCICPGVIDTPMNSRFSPEDMLELKDQTPLNRIGKPCDIAKMVCFLSGDGGDFITGQVITIDGGFSL